MESNYVSEFALFMNRYLADHPEVVEDQQRGWNIYWDKNVDFSDMKKADKDFVPNDSYGFYPTDWILGPPSRESKSD